MWEDAKALHWFSIFMLLLLMTGGHRACPVPKHQKANSEVVGIYDLIAVF